MSTIDSLHPHLSGQRVVNIRDAAAFCGVSVSTFRRMRAGELIPMPIKLSDRRLGWRIRDLLAWIDCRETEREWMDCKNAKTS
ncbi:AlpA family phage regulatory protein [Methylobacterium sp. Leaf86]|uniref:helix-turn-helix transcriptional regulator n=1 Tax=Methylobacterium sp. Leaf86 TaxID=1736242 RepID=UPI0007022511|nr:AlpA family phage regulatory protein [Methylobacterium sp. Leaf86]